MTGKNQTLTFYTGGNPSAKETHRAPLPVSSVRDWSNAEGYIADENLIKAVNVAITVGRPLLVTGEPGTGKSDLAKSVAYNLGLGEPLEFIVKSDMESRDLFYTFDAVGRFNAPKSSGNEPHGPGKANGITEFITYNALGEAILRANKLDDVKPYLRLAYLPDEKWQPQRSVVLIDEVDKAPRDVPNDILSEIDRLEFDIPEFSLQAGKPVKITAPKAFRPIVIITSNLEKSLPDAFLRRCVYYHLPFPSPEDLLKIVESRLGSRYQENSTFVKSACDYFRYLRSENLRLNKRPATAELLDWLFVLLHSLPDGTPLPAHVEKHPRFEDSVLCTLLKTQADQDRAPSLLKGFKDANPTIMSMASTP